MGDNTCVYLYKPHQVKSEQGAMFGEEYFTHVIQGTSPAFSRSNKLYKAILNSSYMYVSKKAKGIE